MKPADQTFEGALQEIENQIARYKAGQLFQDELYEALDSHLRVLRDTITKPKLYLHDPDVELGSDLIPLDDPEVEECVENMLGDGHCNWATLTHRSEYPLIHGASEVRNPPDWATHILLTGK